MAPKKKNGDGVGRGRAGVTFRKKPWTTEVRLPKPAANFKLQGGAYETEEEAHVARDRIAHLRDAAGEEDRASVGGFDGHSSRIYEYAESLKIFEFLECSDPRFCARLDEYKILLERPTKFAFKKFSKAMREEDIAPAIEMLQNRYPQKFSRPSLSGRLPHAEPVDGETHRAPPPSSSEVGVSPTPRREGGASVGEGSTSSFIGASSLKVHITVNDSHSVTLLHMNVPRLPDEETVLIVKAGVERIQRYLIDKVLEELPPCPIDPETIPELDPETNPAWE